MKNELVSNLLNLIIEFHLKNNSFIKRLRKLKKNLPKEDGRILRKDFMEFYKMKKRNTLIVLYFGFLKLKQFCSPKNIKIFITKDFKICLKKLNLKWKLANLNFFNEDNTVFERFDQFCIQKRDQLILNSTLIMNSVFNKTIEDLKEYLPEYLEKNNLKIENTDHISFPTQMDLDISKQLLSELLPNFPPKIEIQNQINGEEEFMKNFINERKLKDYHELNSSFFEKLIKNKTDSEILTEMFPTEQLEDQIKYPILLIKKKRNFKELRRERVEFILNEISEVIQNKDNLGVLKDESIWMKYIFYPENEEFKSLLESCKQKIELELRKKSSNEKFIITEEADKETYLKIQLNDILKQMDEISNNSMDTDLMKRVWNQKLNSTFDLIKSQEEMNFNSFKEMERKLKIQENEYIEHHIHIRDIFKFLQFAENTDFNLF
jgi:hypothetical protein